MSTGTTENLVSSDAPMKDAKFSFMPEVHEQLAFVAASWNANGMVNLQSEALKNISKTIVAEDIETHRASAIQKLQNALSKVPLNERSDLQAKIDAVATASRVDQIDALTNEVLRDIENTAQFASTGINIQDQQSKEDQHIQQLLFSIDEADKKIKGYLGDMEACGVEFDPAKKKRMAELQEWVDVHPNDKKSPMYQEYVALQHDMADDAEKQANDPHSHVTDRTRVKEDVQKVRLTEAQREQFQKELEEANKARTDRNIKVSLLDKSRQNQQISEDDDEPSVAQNENVTTPVVAKQETKQEHIEIGQLSAPQFAGAKQPGGTSRTV